MPGRAVCSARGPGGRWTPWHAERAPAASGGANEVGHESTAERAQLGCRVGWRRLRLVVGHATTARPEASTLGVVGDRGSRRESCLPLVPGSGSTGQALDFLKARRGGSLRWPLEQGAGWVVWQYDGADVGE